MTTYVQLNIGRNVGDVPMPARRWNMFICDARRALERAGENVVVSCHVGAGRWTDERGRVISEDSAYLSAMLDRSGIPAIRDAIAELREKYNQDAIALIIGSELI